MNFNLKFLFNLVWILGLTTSMFGQSLSGKIIDPDKTPVYGAVIRVEDGEGKFLMGVSSNEEGQFNIDPLPSNARQIVIQSMTYEEYKKSITPDQLTKNTSLGTISLNQSKTYQLGQVDIQGSYIAIEQRDDTTAFNADAFKTNPDATAEDLLKKMPGLDFSSGAPKSQGENITKVLVDGKPFFGDDPSATLKNLPAEIIAQVELYDEKSEEAKFTGFDDGETSKTINIVTKPEAKAGWFGKVNAGIGDEGKYLVGGNINIFKGARRITILGHTNNINQQNFSVDDVMGMSSGGRRGGGGFRSQNPSSNFMVGGQSGITTTHALGVNYNDELFNEKLEMNASYFFNKRSNIQENELLRQYILSEQLGQSYKEENLAESNNTSHQFNARLEYKLDTMTSFLLIPSISIQDMNSKSDLYGLTFSELNPLINSTLNHSENKFSNVNARTMVMIRHKFNKPGRTISLWGRVAYNQRDGIGLLNAENTYEVDSLDNVLNQEFKEFNQGLNINSNLTYTEPITKKIGIQAQYGLRFENGESDRKTYDYNDEASDYNQLVPNLSNEFTTEYLTHRGGLTLRMQDSLYSLNIGMNVQNATLTNERRLPTDFSMSKTFESYLPFARFRYRFTKTSNLWVSFRTFTDAPSVNQLQDVIDNENPLQLSKGNRDLNHAKQGNLRLSFNHTNPKDASNFNVSISGRVTNDYIGRATLIAEEDMILEEGIILPRGAQLRTPVNIDGYRNFTMYSSYGRAIEKLKVNLNTNLNLGYTKTPGMLNNEINFAQNTFAGLGIGFSSNISENIDFNIATNGTYNWVVNSLNESSNQEFYNQMTNASLYYNIWKGLVFHTEASHHLYTGLSDGYNQNFILWNVSLGKKFLKNNRAEVKLMVNDLLGQNSSIQRTVSEIYSEDVRTNVLQRYVMLSFTYNIRAFGGASPNQENSRRF